MSVPTLFVPSEFGIDCVGLLSGFAVIPVSIGAHSGPVVRPVVLVLVGIVCVLPLCFVFGCVELGLTYRFHSDSVPCVIHSNFVQFGVHFLAQVGSLIALASL